MAYQVSLVKRLAVMGSIGQRLEFQRHSGALTGAITAACPGMGAVATGIVHGVVGAGTYAATELVNGRTPTLGGKLAAGITSGVLAGGAKAISNKLTTTKLYRSVSTAEAKVFQCWEAECRRWSNGR